MSGILSAVKWTDLIVNIGVNERVNFPLHKKTTVRSVISTYMGDEYPGREFKTWINKEEETITVYRVK